MKAIMVKKDKLGVPRPKEVYDSSNEPYDEEELRAYQSRYKIRENAQGEVGQSSTQPPPPLPPSHEEDPVSPSTMLEDQVHDLTARFDAYCDETQKHQVSISQDMDKLKADMTTVLCNRR